MNEQGLRKLVATQIAELDDERLLSAVSSWTPLYHELPGGWLVFRVGPHAEIGYSTVEHWADHPWCVIFDNRGDLVPDVYTESLPECVDEVLTRFGGDPGDGPHEPPDLSGFDSPEMTREEIAAKALAKRNRKRKR